MIKIDNGVFNITCRRKYRRRSRQTLGCFASPHRRNPRVEGCFGQLVRPRQHQREQPIRDLFTGGLGLPRMVYHPQLITELNCRLRQAPVVFRHALNT